MDAVEFVDEMSAVLLDNGFEEDVYAEGSGRTFRNMATVYVETHGGRCYLFLSRQWKPWEDSKALELELPKDCWESDDFRRMMAEIIVKYDEEVL